MLFSALITPFFASTIRSSTRFGHRSFLIISIFAAAMAFFEGLTSILATVIPAYISMDFLSMFTEPLNGVLYAWCGLTQFPFNLFVGSVYVSPFNYQIVAGFQIGSLTIPTGYSMLNTESFVPSIFDDPSLYLQNLEQYRTAFLLARFSTGITVLPILFMLNLVGAFLGLGVYHLANNTLMPRLRRIGGSTRRPLLTKVASLLGLSLLIGLIACISVVSWAYMYHYPFYPWNFP